LRGERAERGRRVMSRWGRNAVWRAESIVRGTRGAIGHRRLEIVKTQSDPRESKGEWS
jgi:hypothetical protein